MVVSLRSVYRFASGARYARGMSTAILHTTHAVLAAPSVPPAVPRASASTDPVVSTVSRIMAGLTERRARAVMGVADACTGFSAACGRLAS